MKCLLPWICPIDCKMQEGGKQGPGHEHSQHTRNLKDSGYH
ncbi:hypothetical protein yberc0001_39910 [Yersinia bercovieri ATCC 43970]|uniref:Uncharacterized protein n=1 Tax=Yersinia bercovieri ATCC 43970 TaxID=349968 RepID=A0ABM9XUD5_YERBE|nr:hypothetical protein yberc0001_39910 [Yersinia bercovieri ATCC 43970]